MERPNTVAGLEAKRAELVKLRAAHEAEIRKLTCDIDHLEAAIALFDPANTPAAIRAYVVKHRAKKGHMKRFVLAQLREAAGSLTSLQITDALIAERGLRPDDQTRIVMRKRVGACLIAARREGIVSGGLRDGRVWRLLLE